jgi:Protein of unknown function (DUF723)
MQPADLATLLRERLIYDRATGALYRNPAPGLPAGQRLGCPNSGGKRQATFAGKRYQVDALIWLLETGAQPISGLSHKNGDNADDRFENLTEERRRPVMTGLVDAFIAKAKARFPEAGHDFSLVRYVNTATRVRIVCPKHGAFDRTPESYLTSSCGCPRCGVERHAASVTKSEEERRQTARRYREANRALYNGAARKYYLKNIHANPSFTVALACRNLLARVLHDTKRQQSNRTAAMLGYTFVEFKAHIERQFEPWMSWANHGEWHVDHIYPVSRFIRDGVTDVKVINALSNLRPLAKGANLSKKDRLVA